MPGPVFLYGDGIELRTVEEADLDWMREHVNRPEVRHRFPGPEPTTEGAMEERFEEDYSDDESVDLLVVPEDGDDRVGMVTVFDHEPIHATAEIGAWTVPEHWGEGFATAAAERVVAYAFRERRIERLEANALATNEASRAVIEKIGFVEEGRQRAHQYVTGERVDRVNYGLLREEWEDE